MLLGACPRCFLHILWDLFSPSHLFWMPQAICCCIPTSAFEACVSPHHFPWRPQHPFAASAFSLFLRWLSMCHLIIFDANSDHLRHQLPFCSLEALHVSPHHLWRHQQPFATSISLLFIWRLSMCLLFVFVIVGLLVQQNINHGSAHFSLKVP